ncbi:PapD-like protein [Dichotomocladium elegans]|nr:PapD-like protein [Dichotomocladium elegans]
MSVQLEPASQLTFQRPLTQVSKELLLVNNPGNDPVMFKVKTTAPKQYCVRPNAGRIEPHSQVEVQVILQPFKEEPAADFKCKDKFLVQTAVIKPAHEALPIAEMWSIAEAEDRASIFQQKIKCVFLPPEQEQEPTPSDTMNYSNEPHHHQQQHLPEPPVVVAAPAPPAPVVEDAPIAHIVKEEPTEPQLEPLTPTAAVAAAMPVIAPTSVPDKSPPVITPVPAPLPAKTAADPAPEPKPRSIPPPVPNSRADEEISKPATSATASQPTTEDLEKKRLREDLREARVLVDQLKSQIAALQKEQEAGKLSRKLAPTVQPLDAVHQHLAALEKPQVPEGYPPQVVLVVAGLVFIFTYLFF